MVLLLTSETKNHHAKRRETFHQLKGAIILWPVVILIFIRAKAREPFMH